MQIELCFHDEINQLCEPPNTFVDLLKSATSSFGTDLPEKWALGLIDSQCGIIYLNDETDYQELLRRKLANKSKRILINIIPEVKQAKSSEKNSQSYSDSLSFTKGKK